jgi:hypothetical protein
MISHSEPAARDPAATDATGAAGVRDDPAATGAAVSPRPAMIARLVAGRGTFRISIQLMAVALIAVWGLADYGLFANAIGLSLWLVFLPTAAEKTALKIVPRTRLIQAAVARLCLRIAVVPVLMLHAALGLALLVSWRSTAVLYLAAACWSSGTGLLMTISGLHRLRARPGLDAAAFGCAAGVVLGATGLTWFTGWSPHAHLLVLVTGMVVLVVLSARALPRAWVRADGRPARRLLPAVGRGTGLLGMSEILDAAVLSAVFAVLAAAGRTADSGPLYLALLVAGAAGTFVLYQLKLHQPAASARLRGAGGTPGRARALAKLRIAERLGLVFAVAVAVALLVPSTRPALQAGSPWLYPILTVLVIVEILVFTVVLYAGFLLENTNNRVLAATSTAAVIGLAAAVLLAIALVPPLGATGAFVAIIVAMAVKAHALRQMLLRNHPELRKPPEPRTPDAATN